VRVVNQDFLFSYIIKLNHLLILCLIVAYIIRYVIRRCGGSSRRRRCTRM